MNSRTCLYCAEDDVLAQVRADWEVVVTQNAGIVNGQIRRLRMAVYVCGAHLNTACENAGTEVTVRRAR